MNNSQESSKLVFACMYGQERSVQLQSLAKDKGYRTELLAGGLLTLQNFLKKLAILAEIITDNEFIKNHQQIHYLIAFLAESPTEIFDSLQINSSHDSYYFELVTEAIAKKRERKFIVTIDEEEQTQASLPLEYLRSIGEVIILDYVSAHVALATNCFDELFDNQALPKVENLIV